MLDTNSSFRRGLDVIYFLFIGVRFLGWPVVGLDELKRIPDYRFVNGVIYAGGYVYVPAGGSSVKRTVKRNVNELCFRCRMPINGSAIEVEVRELYEKRPLKDGPYARGSYVWIEHKHYYHPRCYYGRTMLGYLNPV